MKLSKNHFYSFPAPLILCIFSILYSPVTTATYVSSFEATHKFTFTLNNVVDTSGKQVTSGWSILGEWSGGLSGYDIGDARRNIDWGADFDPLPYIFFNIGDSATFTASLGGEAYHDVTTVWDFGEAAISGGMVPDVVFQNVSGQPLIYNFDYDIALSTKTFGDASVTAVSNTYIGESFLNHEFSIEALSESSSSLLDAEEIVNTINLQGSFSLMLDNQSSNVLWQNFDMHGNASFQDMATVPEPSTMLLMTISLAGFSFAKLKS